MNERAHTPNEDTCYSNSLKNNNIYDVRFIVISYASNCYFHQLASPYQIIRFIVRRNNSLCVLEPSVFSGWFFRYS